MNTYQDLQNTGYVPTYDADSDQWIGVNAELEKIKNQAHYYKDCLGKQSTETINKAIEILTR